jgi:hypothetical protein
LAEEIVAYEGEWLVEPHMYTGHTVAFKGEWISEDTFRFFYINVGHTEGTNGEIKFIGNSADISVKGPYGGRLRLKGVRE